MSQIELFLAGLVTIAIWSFLFKDNPVYRVVEYAYVGAGSANLIVTTWQSYLKPTLTQDIGRDGKYILLIPLLIGGLAYLRLLPKLAAWSRIPVALWVGIGSGYVLAYQPAPLIGQITSSFMKLNSVDNIVFTVFFLATMAFFVFTIGESSKGWKVYRPASYVGRIAIMVGLGAAFGNTVMARMSLLLGRIQFVLIDWLKLTK